MRTIARAATALGAALATVSASAGAIGLGGSRSSMRQQHGVAVEQAYTFLATQAQVRAFVADGLLEPMASTADVALSDVSYPYARPEVRLFVERIAAQYHAATGERLVVTSLVRPRAEQPSNASPLSVHPAGMAVDLRVPADSAKRRWLERTLLALEQQGVLDATREHRPSHFHVAVFPAAYRAFVDRQTAAERTAAASAPALAAPRAPEVAAPATGVATTAPARGRGPWAAAAALLLAIAVCAGTATSARLAPAPR